MSLTIRPVHRAHEVAAIQHQRYAIYVEELGYPQRYADPATRRVAEPLDDTGVLFGAFDGDRLVGSVRVNHGSDGDLLEYVELFGLRRFGRWFPEGVSIVTKLMIEPAYRRGTLLARIGQALYRHTVQTRPRTQFCMVDSVPEHAGFFLRLGYRPIGPHFLDPAAGVVLPMAFPVFDLEHFRRVRSPLAAVCPFHDETSAAWFRQHLAIDVHQAQGCAA